MSAFENSWERLDKERNPSNYETITTEHGKEVNFLKGSNNKPRFTKEEQQNIEIAVEKMNDRED